MKLCVTGGREWTDRRFIWKRLDTLHLARPVTVLGHGDARGVDRICRDWAKARRITDKPYPADWDNLGDDAGFIRNGEMLDDFQPDLLAVFPGGNGTMDCARQARKKGFERIWFDEHSDPLEAFRKWG